jgi:hypothetical protein
MYSLTIRFGDKSVGIGVVAAVEEIIFLFF